MFTMIDLRVMNVIHPIKNVRIFKKMFQLILPKTILAYSQFLILSPIKNQSIFYSNKNTHELIYRHLLVILKIKNYRDILYLKKLILTNLRMNIYFQIQKF